VGVIVNGIKKLNAKFKNYPSELDKENRLILQRAGKAVKKEARKTHNYNNPPHTTSNGLQYSPSGNLTRSIKYVTTQKKYVIAVQVYLDPTLITTSSGLNYGIIQHDGMGSGYKPSPFSPRYSTTGRNNLEHDWFLYNAWEDYLPTLKKQIKKAPLKAWRQA
jgi:hypothetical protein